MNIFQILKLNMKKMKHRPIIFLNEEMNACPTNNVH